jgi:periplasmic divalent cation tolerance protein
MISAFHDREISEDPTNLMSDYVLVLTTWPADRDADRCARTLVEEALAACVNVLPPMTSVYRWEGNVEQAAERQLIMKTSRGRVGALRDRLLSLHPYDVPEFLVIEVKEGSDAYLKWIAESTKLNS